MILDKQNLFSDDQAITATASSTDVIDLGDPSIGKGDIKEVEILVQVTADFDSAADDGTLVVALRTGATASPTTVLVQTAAIAEADLVAGYQFSLATVPVNTLQYIDLNFTVAGSGDFTAGTITAGLVLDRQTNGA
jgi:hypothetical protein